MNPQNITVVLGINNTTTWENPDTVAQSIVGCNLFNSGLLKPGASFNYTFTTLGIFTYSIPTCAWESGTVTISLSTATASAVGSNPDDNY